MTDQVSDEEYYRRYKETWGPGPHVTADAVVLCRDARVLLVRRGRPPGQNLLAIPGGFINLDERLLDAALRELKEETGISDEMGLLSDETLRAALRSNQVFDDPHRSGRGRIITHAFLFRLPGTSERYRVAGSDDAADAGWYSPNELEPSQMFEDHWHILKALGAL